MMLRSARNGNRLAILSLFALLALMLMSSTVRPVLAYSGGEGNSNSWVSTSSTECQNGNYSPAVLGMAWDTGTPVLSSDDNQGVTGEWSWQTNVQTEQKLTSSGNEAGYQYVQYVQNYELTDPWLEVLLPPPTNYQMEGGQTSWTAYNTYYVGGPSASLNLEVEADATWSNGVITAVTYYLWDNGVLQSHSISVSIPAGYQATPVAYQNVLVSVGTSGGKIYSPVAFTGGTGDFYTFGNSQYKNTACVSWGTGETSNMGYYAWPGSCSNCYQDYTVANEYPSIAVQSVDQNGNLIYGYYTQLDTTGYGYIASGYTTYTYSDTYVTNGTSYYLYADSYGSCTFNHWSDGSASVPRLVTPSDEMRLTAVYDCT
jgi:hypothetical protein